MQKKNASNAISLKMKEVDEQRKKAQPQQIKTAGSTFKNPKDQTDKKAWEIIEEAGLKILSFKEYVSLLSIQTS